MSNPAKLRITWVKSAIGYNKKQKATIAALGLRKLGQVVEKPDTPQVRGMVFAVRHLVKCEEVKE
ncbi:MAG: 50S ribosomal protein L30 [Anaerolineae bacterium]|nr:50S ribosomal protein L30 [Anaerolineae bacterium]